VTVNRNGPFIALICIHGEVGFYSTYQSFGWHEPNSYVWEVSAEYETIWPDFSDHVDQVNGLEYEADEFGLDYVIDTDRWFNEYMSEKRWLDIMLRRGWVFGQSIYVRYWWCSSHTPSSPSMPEEYNTWLELEEIGRAMPTEQGMAAFASYVAWLTGDYVPAENRWMVEDADKITEAYFRRGLHRCHSSGDDR
jgi:hypothetical protein